MIVSDEAIDKSACWSVDNKYQNEQDVRGKYIQVWKQEKSMQWAGEYKKATIQSAAKGLIIDIQNNATSVQNGMQELFGKSWSAYKGNGQVYSILFF